MANIMLFSLPALVLLLGLLTDQSSALGLIVECSNSTCSNGGTCEQMMTVVCTCPSGFTGQYCEREDTYYGRRSYLSRYYNRRGYKPSYTCSDTPCRNGGTCDEMTTIKCTCAPGFAGDTCDDPIRGSGYYTGRRVRYHRRKPNSYSTRFGSAGRSKPNSYSTRFGSAGHSRG